MITFIPCKIKEITIKDNEILVRCVSEQMGLQTPQILLLSSPLVRYYPKINDIVLVYKPLSGMIDRKYMYAILYQGKLLDGMTQGDGCIGIDNNYIKFLDGEANKIEFTAQNLDLANCQNVSFKNDGVNLLNENAQMKVVIQSGSSAGTYPVEIDDAGTKIKS